MSRLFNDGSVVVGLDLSGLASSDRDIPNFDSNEMPVVKRKNAWMKDKPFAVRRRFTVVC